jgi:hypothetical protein
MFGVDRGVQYMFSMARKCAMVKAWGSRKKKTGGNLYMFRSASMYKLAVIYPPTSIFNSKKFPVGYTRSDAPLKGGGRGRGGEVRGGERVTGGRLRHCFWERMYAPGR